MPTPPCTVSSSVRPPSTFMYVSRSWSFRYIQLILSSDSGISSSVQNCIRFWLQNVAVKSSSGRFQLTARSGAAAAAPEAGAAGVARSIGFMGGSSLN